MSLLSELPCDHLFGHIEKLMFRQTIVYDNRRVQSADVFGRITAATDKCSFIAHGQELFYASIGARYLLVVLINGVEQVAQKKQQKTVRLIFSFVITFSLDSVIHR